MARHAARLILFLLFLTHFTAGQGLRTRQLHPVSVEIQVYLPDGQKPKRPVVVHIQSADGRINQVQYTTTSGFTYFSNIERHTPLTVTVLGEEGFYRTNSLSFEANDGLAEVHLQADGPMNPVVSVGALHQPLPKARKLYEKALRDLEGDHMDSAEERLKEAAALDPRYSQPVVGLGLLRLSQKRWPEAETLFARALELDGESPQALAGLGIAHSRQGNFEAAVAPLEKAAARLPEPEVLLHFGVSLLETGRSDEAERVLLRAAEKPGPFRDPSALVLGKLYVQRGDKERGLATFESILKSPGPAADLARKAIRMLRDEDPPR